MVNKIVRPALRFYGGKFNLTDWIISYMPEHNIYVDLCGGGASVFLLKKRVRLEIYNDINKEVVNFFEVLRDNPEVLIRKIELTPWARDEYKVSKQIANDKIENARRFFIGNMLSISGNPKASGFRLIKNSKDIRITYSPNYEYLQAIAKRLLSNSESMVEIENDDWQKVFKKFDSKETLFYFDPPYLKETRTSKKEYDFEWTNEQHIEAGEVLQSHKGFVLVSGYDNELYSELYKGWHKVTKEAQTNTGGKRIESLWLSPQTYNSLNEQRIKGKLF